MIKIKKYVKTVARYLLNIILPQGKHMKHDYVFGEVNTIYGLFLRHW